MKNTSPEIIKKPWGHEEIWAHTDKYVGKLLCIRPDSSLSYQFHEKKDETIRILEGEMKFEYEDEGGSRISKVLKSGDSFHIKPQTKHRMTAVTKCIVLEVSTPELDDVVRIEDDYDR